MPFNGFMLKNLEIIQRFLIPQTSFTMMFLRKYLCVKTFSDDKQLNTFIFSWSSDHKISNRRDLNSTVFRPEITISLFCPPRSNLRSFTLLM